MIERLVEQIEERFEDLSKQMTDPGVIADRARYAEVGRAYRALEPAHKLAEADRKAADDAAGARASPRPSRRDVSTPPPPPWRSCPRLRRWRSRSTRTTSTSTSTGAPAPAASP